MVPPASATTPLRVLVLSLSAACGQALEAALSGRGVVVTLWNRLPLDRDHWGLLSRADVVLLACDDDVDSEFVTIERIRDATPLVEIVCVCDGLEVEAAVESLRAGVFAVIPYSLDGDRLIDVLSSAAARRRRATARILALDAQASGANRPTRSSD